MVTLFGHQEADKDTDPKQTPVAPNLAPFTERFLVARQNEVFKDDRSTESTIRVSDVLGSIAHLYERIRNVIEYKGEHVLRRNAIERILKRLLWERAGHDTERIAMVLIRELIWARYLPNDTIPKSKIKAIAQTINKYLHLLGLINPVKGADREWIWGIASCDIEEALDPASREPYIILMLEWFKTFFEWKDESVSEHEKDIQLYLAIHRALTKSDDEIMRYHLFLIEFPDWLNAKELEIAEVSRTFFSLKNEIETHLNFKDSLTLFRVVQKHVAPFEVFKNIVYSEGNRLRTLLQDESQFFSRVSEVCEVKYRQIQNKVNRGVIRSIIYIFVTKVLLALLIEIPYEIYRFGKLTYVPLAINILIPPSMMWLIGLTIRTPGSTNTQRIISRLKTIVYTSVLPDKTVFSVKRIHHNSLLRNIFVGLYMLLFLLVFGVITVFLLRLHYTWVGLFIFFAFLSLVLLFGFRVRFTASELSVTSEKEGFFGYLFNNFTLPFLSTGVYLSKGLAKINFLTIVLDFLIEAPLKTIIEVFEEWTSFIREKREEVVEVPE